MSTFRVAQYGLGPIGLASVAAVLRKSTEAGLELVAAIDIDPEKVGRDVGVLAGMDPVGLTVTGDAAETLRRTAPDVVLHTTSSFLPAVEEQLAQCVRSGAHVVSSTEELSYPFERHPELSRRLDAVASECGKVILGTGVNPGYAMDMLALAATGVCLDVRRVTVERVVDASKRRLPLQRKVGAGLSAGEFDRLKATGKFGHIGLCESLWMVAAGLGWRLETVEEELEPVLANHLVETPYSRVEPGQVAGIHHTVVGRVGGEVVLSLDLRMFVGAEDPRDSVRVEGNPPIDLVVRDGIFGDTATVAALVNAIPLVAGARPGLKTVVDLPVPRAFGTGPGG